MVLAAPTVFHGAELSGQPGAQTFSGLCNQISEAAENVRVNKTFAVSLSQRVVDIIAVVSEAVGEDVASDDISNAVELFKSILRDIHVALVQQGNRSYLSQLLTQQRDKDHLNSLAERAADALRVFLTRMRIKNDGLAVTLREAVGSLTADRMAQLSALPASRESITGPALPSLPPRPSLHFGRDLETQTLVDVVTGSSPGRVCVLGGPGMGKTTLATIVSHHPSVIQRFGPRRVFVRCDAAEGHQNCLSIVAQAFGLLAPDLPTAQRQLRDALAVGPLLLVLDNFESVWEVGAVRPAAEEALRFLNAFDGLSILVTLRGSERPGGLSWTRPFFPPLGPLSHNASRQTFLSISDVFEADADMEVLLGHVDRIPLAIVLMANLAQYESIRLLLERWSQMQTSMLVRGAGNHRLSSLDVSISLSLDSPRMQAAPSARVLLGVLSLLPQGALESDVHLWNLEPIHHSLAVLAQNSLVIRTAEHRIHVLSPIRSFMLSHYSPSPRHSAMLCQHYFGLAKVASDALHPPFNYEVVSVVGPELSNIDAVIRWSLKHLPLESSSAIQAVIHLCDLYNHSSVGSGPDLVPAAVAAAQAHGLDELHATLLFQAGRTAFHSTRTSFHASLPGSAESLLRQALPIFERIDHPLGIINSRLFLSLFLPPRAAINEVRVLFDMCMAQGRARLAARCAQELSEALERDGRLQEAIAQLELALSILNQHSQDGVPELLVGRSKYRLAEKYAWMGELERAIGLFEEALPIFQATHSSIGLTTTHTQLADLYILQGQPKLAIIHANRALAAQNTDFGNIAEDIVMLTRAHAQAGDMGAALSAIELSNEYRPPGGWSPSAQAHILLARGHLALASNEVVEARAVLYAAQELTRKHDPVETPENLAAAEARILNGLSEAECISSHHSQAAVFALTAAALSRARTRIPSCVLSLVLLAEAVDDSFSETLITAVLLPLRRMKLHHGLAMALVRSASIAQNRGEHLLAAHRAQAALIHFDEVKDERRSGMANAMVAGGRGVTVPAGV